MAQLIGFGGDASSNLVSGVGTSSAVFTMPGNVGVKLESVVALIDNTAGSAATLTLTIRDPAGNVVAAHQLGDTIAAGDTGSATWALRLVDSGAGGIRFNRTNQGGFLTIRLGATESYNLQDRSGNNLIHYNEQGVLVVNVPVGGIWEVNRGGGSPVLSVDGTRALAIACSDWFLTANGTTTISLTGATSISTRDVAITTRVATWKLANAGNTFTVLDHSGNPIFRVDESGDLHGKTGKALTFDL